MINTLVYLICYNAINVLLFCYLLSRPAKYLELRSEDANNKSSVKKKQKKQYNTINDDQDRFYPVVFTSGRAGKI